MGKKHNNSIIKATALVFALTLFAKVLGFAKSMIQASYYGASLEMDAFNVSSGFVSNVLYMLMTALAVAFVPLYIQLTKEKRKEFASKTITALLGCALILSLLLYLSGPYLIRLIAPSFDKVAQEKALRYFRVLLIGIPFSLMVNLYTSVLNAEKRYGFSTVHSITNSAVMILVIVLFSEKLGVWALVLSLLGANLIQWVVMYPVVKKYAPFRIRQGVKEGRLKLLLLQAFPILISQATVEVNQVIDRALLTSIEEGVLTAVSYSAVLYQFASSLISTPVATVMFTELSEAGAESDNARMCNLLQDSSKIFWMICLPVMLVILFTSNEIVTIVYGRGKFGLDAIHYCAQGLIMYSLCLLPGCLKTVFIRALYSKNNTKSPMLLGLIEVIINIGLSILLIKPFGVLGVVGATAIASLFAYVLTVFVFQRNYFQVFKLKYLLSYWKTLVAFSISTIIMILTRTCFNGVILKFFANTVLCFGVYFLSLMLLRENDLIHLIKKVRNKI